jgi:hypothetical protein
MLTRFRDRPDFLFFDGIRHPHASIPAPEAGRQHDAETAHPVLREPGPLHPGRWESPVLPRTTNSGFSQMVSADSAADVPSQRAAIWRPSNSTTVAPSSIRSWRTVVSGGQ